MQKTEEYYLSWEEYGQLIDELVKKVKVFLNDQRPSIFVIPTNGYMISQPLSKHLKLSYTQYESIRTRVNLSDVIIVDDLIDTGKTINNIVSTLSGVPLALVCLYKKVWSPTLPRDMKLITVRETDKWIHYPWEPEDEIVNRDQQVICHFDGASKNNQSDNRNASCGYTIKVDETFISKQSFNVGNMTNNEAEYHGLMSLLIELHDRNIKEAIIYGDSQLVIQQVKGKYKCKAANLQPYLNRIKQLSEGKKYTFEWIDRDKNNEVNQLIGGKH